MNKQEVIFIKCLIAIALIVLFIFIIWYGFNTKTFESYHLRQIGEAYQTAEYSEYICGLDYDGEISCDTDYWSEPGSEVWGFTADNGKLKDSNIPQNLLSHDKRYLLYSMDGCPQKWRVPTKNLDSFRRHQDYTYLVLLDKEYSTNLEKFKTFSKFRQQKASIEVDLWYFHIRDIRSASL